MSQPGEDPLAAFEAAAGRLAAIRAESRANVERAARVSDEARSATAIARSPRGEISATAQAGGVITDLDFAEAAYDLTPDELSRVVLRVIAQAQHDAARRFADAAGEAFGSDSPTASALRSEAKKAFPAPAKR